MGEREGASRGMGYEEGGKAEEQKRRASSDERSKTASVFRPATLLPCCSSVMAKQPGRRKQSMSSQYFLRCRSVPRLYTCGAPCAMRLIPSGRRVESLGAHRSMTRSRACHTAGRQTRAIESHRSAPEAVLDSGLDHKRQVDHGADLSEVKVLLGVGAVERQGPDPEVVDDRPQLPADHVAVLLLGKRLFHRRQKLWVAEEVVVHLATQCALLVQEVCDT